MKTYHMCSIVFLILASSALSQEKAPPVNRYKALRWYEKNGIEPPKDLLPSAPSRVRFSGFPLEGDEPDVRIHATLHNQLEISIAVNESNPSQLFTSFYEDDANVFQPWYFSTNSGSSWFGTGLPPAGVTNLQISGDPVALFDFQNRAYYSPWRPTHQMGLAGSLLQGPLISVRHGRSQMQILCTLREMISPMR